jgi:hypothetical protein
MARAKRFTDMSHRFRSGLPRKMIPSLPLRASSETGPIANAQGFLGNRSRR